jgi:hypothetical protein
LGATLLYMPTRVEAYLTGKAAAVWPAALIVRVDDEHGTRFYLQRPGQADLELGGEFNEARRALYATIKHHKAGGKLPG